MLMLGRNPEEYIVINDNIIVKVIDKDGYLRLGIDAPKGVSIVRGEVYERTHKRPKCVNGNTLV